MIKQFTLLLSISLLLASCNPGLESDPRDESSVLEGMGSDPCLQGTWTMSNSDVEALLASLAPIPGMTIPSGSLVMAFTGDDFSYAAQDLVMRIGIPGGYMEAEAGFLFYGSFATSDGMIAFSETIYDAEILVWRASIDGNITEAPGPQVIAFPMPGGGPYECTTDMLTIDAVGGSGETNYLIFYREG